MDKAYVSCIKIKGVPILPPLITPENKKQLQEYKQRALALEELYLKKSLQLKVSSVDDKSENDNSKHVCAVSTIPFIDEGVGFSSIQKLNSMKYVPYTEEKSRISNLSTDIIDVSEYSLSFFDKNSMTEDELTASVVELDFDKSFSCGDSTKIKLDKSIESTETNDGNADDSENGNEDSGKPRLIRSNSYVLDNPSPLLVEHLKRQRLVSLSSAQTAADAESGDYDGIRAESCSSSTSKDYSRISIPTEIENISDNLLDLSSTDILEESKTNLPLLTVNTQTLNHPAVEVITTDITVQQINITTSIDKDIKEDDLMNMLNDSANSNSVESNNEKSSNSDPDIELKSILQEIPQMYANKILELIERQRIEQQKRSQNFENLKRDLLYSGDFKDESVNSTTNRILVGSNKGEATPTDSSASLEVSRNISEQISPNFNTIQRSRTSSLIKNHQPSTLGAGSEESTNLNTANVVNDEDGVDLMDLYQKSNPMISGEVNRNFTNNNSQSNVGFIRRVVSDERILRRSKEEKAASVITAYVRGYLVRRLMKTTKIQTLIQTIQDALVCALELQRSETIEEADVELHRRLIQQVSAACYEFHDTFFALSVPEQMDLIAIDREKKKKSRSLRITRSTIDLHPKTRSTTNLRLTKSLTKV